MIRNVMIVLALCIFAAACGGSGAVDTAHQESALTAPSCPYGYYGVAWCQRAGSVAGQTADVALSYCYNGNRPNQIIDFTSVKCDYPRHCEDGGGYDYAYCTY